MKLARRVILNMINRCTRVKTVIEALWRQIFQNKLIYETNTAIYGTNIKHRDDTIKRGGENSRRWQRVLKVENLRRWKGELNI